MTLFKRDDSQEPCGSAEEVLKAQESLAIPFADTNKVLVHGAEVGTFTRLIFPASKHQLVNIFWAHLWDKQADSCVKKGVHVH
ncbi:hypothetical protein FKM82_026092 [Ascaphus truei]